MRSLLLSLALLAGCTGSPAPSSDPFETQADYEAALAHLSEQIAEAIGGAEAASEDACRVIGVGVKPCGGPWEYRVYSETSGEPDEVQRLVAEYNALNGEMNERFELASTCEFLLEPTPTLDARRCLARPASPDG